MEAQIEQLKAAKALFVEMEVPKRVAQVDEALGKITNLKAGNPDKTKRSLTLKSAPAVPVVIAVSRSMSDIMELVERVKDRDMSVLITGETGTGKDLLAEYIHATGNRSGGPFTAINCAAVPENLLECELFGVKKGTYTGSTADKPGLIESADGGTFYFDEIGDAPAAIQSKLLRVIETKTVRRLGANEDVRVNVRFIAATNHNLQERIASKEFRRDLYYRLAEVEIGLPPLRERREDVMPLISRFLKTQDIELTTAQYGQLESRLNGYDWPGNVREVRHLVNLATLTNTNGDLIPALESALSMLNHPDVTESKAALIEMLERHQGNISGMARELGIPRTTLISHLKKFGLL
ncbi:MAG: sigma-54-dependent Fis family transcriptional regulator [bacterium]|nr:sigma-54-dependent Fis family transcriptional regulator [bacterium]